MLPIFLIGYMAAGKTTLGRAIAKMSGKQFLDLDFYIEQRFRKSVAEIFAERGEAEFRRMEAAMLREIGEFEDVVISCGGGTPCFGDNMEYMNSRGITFFLDASIPVLTKRIIAGGAKRPITAKYSPEELPGFIESHLSQRLPFYKKAKHTIEADHLESRQDISKTTKIILEIL